MFSFMLDHSRGDGGLWGEEIATKEFRCCRMAIGRGLLPLPSKQPL